MKILLDIVFALRQFANCTNLRMRAALKWYALPNNVRGGLTMLLATFFLSVMVVLIKIAGQRLHVTEILLFRQLTMVAIAAPVIFSNFPHSLHTARPKLQLLRILFAFFAMVLGFSAVIHLPLAEVTAIAFAKTFFVTVLAIVLLGERVGPRRWGAIGVGFLGVLVIAWPTGAFNVYALMAIVSSACVGTVVIIVRMLMLSRLDKPITIMTYQAIGGGLLMISPAIYFWQTPSLGELALLATIGIFAALGQYLSILSLKAAEASFIGPFDYARLVYSILFVFLIFSEWPEPRVFLGAAFIVAAAIYTLHRKRITAMGETAQ